MPHAFITFNIQLSLTHPLSFSCMDSNRMYPEIIDLGLRHKYFCVLSSTWIRRIVSELKPAFLLNTRQNKGYLLWCPLRGNNTVIATTNVVFGTRCPRSSEPSSGLFPDTTKEIFLPEMTVAVFAQTHWPSKSAFCCRWTPSTSGHRLF